MRVFELLESVSDDPVKWELKDRYRRTDKVESIWRRQNYTIEYIPDHDDPEIFGRLIAVNKNNEVIGDLFFGFDDGQLKGSIEVRPDFRRQGIASDLYDLGEKIAGVNFVPDSPHSRDAEAFWQNRMKK